MKILGLVLVQRWFRNEIGSLSRIVCFGYMYYNSFVGVFFWWYVEYEPGRQRGTGFSGTCTGNLPREKDEVCFFDYTKDNTVCNNDTRYGFDLGHPCILVKMNKVSWCGRCFFFLVSFPLKCCGMSAGRLFESFQIYDWVPDVYTDEASLPADAPKVIRDAMKSSPNESMVWLSCEGEVKIYMNLHRSCCGIMLLLLLFWFWSFQVTVVVVVFSLSLSQNPADRENIGPIEYIPKQGFPAYYFPYKNNERYLSPFVFVRFTSPVTGVLINIECRAWAKNIHHNRMERRGSVHFELLMD